MPRLARGEPVLAVLNTGAWRDVGSIAEYLAANLDWLLESRGEAGAWVHPTATISDDVRVVRSVVGAHAVVEGSGVLENCVVWPRGRARAPLSASVVTGSGAVVRP
jgi:mannose-1-phosphate guanylyltransferase